MGSGPLNCGSTRLGPHPCKVLQKGIDSRALYSSVHGLGIYITLPYVACNVATFDGISHLAFPVTRLFIDGISPPLLVGHHHFVTACHFNISVFVFIPLSPASLRHFQVYERTPHSSSKWRSCIICLMSLALPVTSALSFCKQ